MYVYFPFYDGGWDNLQKVLAYWQSLNAGVIAFISSLVVLYAARLQASEQKKREFQAAKSFLPHVLNEISFHLDECATILKNEHGYLNGEQYIRMQPPIIAMDGLKSISDCIKYSEDDISFFLTELMSLIQIVNARTIGLCKDRTGSNALYIASCFYKLCLVKTKVDRLYRFSRGEQVNVNALICESEIYNSFNAFSLEPHNLTELVRIIEREHSNITKS